MAPADPRMPPACSSGASAGSVANASRKAFANSTQCPTSARITGRLPSRALDPARAKHVFGLRSWCLGQQLLELVLGDGRFQSAAVGERHDRDRVAIALEERRVGGDVLLVQLELVASGAKALDLELGLLAQVAARL